MHQDLPKVAVLGAGNGAHAMAGDLAMRGFPVRIWNKFEHEIAALQAAGGVHVEGAIQGFGPVELVTTDPAPVIAWADVLMLIVPAFAHAAVAEMCAPYLRDEQMIVLNPGRTGGALEVRQVLRRLGVRAATKVAEAQTLIFACRISGPARVHVGGTKAHVSLAALPCADTPAVLDVLRRLYSQFEPASNVLETGLDNIGAMFHPAITVLNAGRIEAAQPFEFYAQGVTPGVARAIEAVDAERLAVGRAFGVRLISAEEWLCRAYPEAQGTSFHERISTNPAYQGIWAPTQLDVRYLTEDVPYGLVPMVSLGGVAGVDTPVIRSMVDLASALLNRDLWQAGRNASSLGLPERGIREVLALL